MTTRPTIILAALLVVAGCSSDDDGPPTGTERGPCYPNNTCNAGLVCLSGLCVCAHDGAALDAGDGGPGDARGERAVKDDGPPRLDLRPLAGTVTTVAGTGQPGFADGPGASAQLHSPTGVVVVGDTLYIADRDNHRIRALDLKSGQVTTVAGDGQQGYLDGPGATARLNAPTALASDQKGSLYVADAGNHRIRKIESGQVTTFAGSGTVGTQTGSLLTASFNSPRGIIMDPWGIIYVSDYLGNMVRKVSKSTVTNLVSPSLSILNPAGLAVDPQGTLFFAETGRHRIAKYLTNTIVGVAGSTKMGFADGDAKFARFNAPSGIVMDVGGSVYVADTGNNRIRLVTGGNVVTLCGETPGYKDGPLDVALFNLPYGIAMDVDKRRIFVADTGNHGIRQIALQP
jgi:DNA-binding beta-propeller fold protein YncE